MRTHADPRSRFVADDVRDTARLREAEWQARLLAMQRRLPTMLIYNSAPGSLPMAYGRMLLSMGHEVVAAMHDSHIVVTYERMQSVLEAMRRIEEAGCADPESCCAIIAKGYDGTGCRIKLR